MKLTWVEKGRVLLNSGECVPDIKMIVRIETVCGEQSRAGVIVPYSGPMILFRLWKRFMVLRGKWGLL